MYRLGRIMLCIYILVEVTSPLLDSMYGVLNCSLLLLIWSLFLLRKNDAVVTDRSLKVPLTCVFGTSFAAKLDSSFSFLILGDLSRCGLDRYEKLAAFNLAPIPSLGGGFGNAAVWGATGVCGRDAADNWRRHVWTSHHHAHCLMSHLILRTAK